MRWTDWIQDSQFWNPEIVFTKEYGSNLIIFIKIMEPTTANKFAQIWISNSLTNAMGPRLLAITLTFTEEVPPLNRNGGTELFFASKEWKSLNVACSCCLWGGNFYAFSVTHSSHVLVGVCMLVLLPWSCTQFVIPVFSSSSPDIWPGFGVVGEEKHSECTCWGCWIMGFVVLLLLCGNWWWCHETKKLH